MLGLDPCGLSNHRGLYIFLDKSDPVYGKGELVSGSASLELQDSLKIIGIELHVYGGAFVRWTEKLPRGETNDERTAIEHTAEEIYVDDTYVLWGQGSSEKHMTEVLTKGKHILPFHVALPSDIPSSFEGPHGWVRYYLRCRVVRPMEDIPSRESQLCFSVLKELDLNLEQSLKDGAKQQRDSVFRSTCCRAGKVTGSLKVQQGGYVPGECIHAEVDVTNYTTSKIKQTSLALIQTVQYGKTDGKQLVTAAELCRVQGDRVRPGRTHCWTSRTGLEVPPVPPSRLDACKFIAVKYELVLRLDLHPSCLTISLPILIGTIPLKASAFTSCKYVKQHIPANCQSNPSLRPDNSTHSLPLDQSDFLPRFKFFSVQSPLTRVLQLDESPGARRKSAPTPKVAFLQHATADQESAV